MSMTDRDYKKLLRLSTMAAFLLIAGTSEDQITQAILKRVEAVAKGQRSLDSVGKSTMEEASIILDLSAGAVPGLLRHLAKPSGDWKARFWVVDMLGYVGGTAAVHDLYKVAVSAGEKRETRKQACKSLRMIAEREPGDAGQILEKVRRAEKIISLSRF